MSATIPLPPRRGAQATDSILGLSPRTPRPAPVGGRQVALDEATFDAVVRCYAAPLCAYVATLVASHAEAEDLVQELFARIWVRGASWDAADPAPYLFTAARNLARNHGRDEGVRGEWARSAHRRGIQDPPLAESPVDIVERAELAEAATDAIANLPRQQRMAFTLSRHHGFTYAQIARALDVSVKTVETQMGRALKALHRRLGPHVAPSLLIAIPAALLARVMELST
jgi:RNA polymerase sigma-70 factor (ECF subfamily)